MSPEEKALDFFWRNGQAVGVLPANRIEESMTGPHEKVTWNDRFLRIISRYIYILIYVYTLPETNIAPENGWLEDEFPFGMAYFQVLC